jgi:GT2 family glycosyltransferase
VLFLDDDVELKPRCVSALWHAIRSDERIGGVNAMIENQRSVAPGLFSRALFRVAGGDGRPAAGRCLGPALNVLPADDPELPAIVTVEWLNTTCTLYRRAALPSPLFPAHFTGYSFGEDLDLSLRVGRSWRLVNAHDARVVHHSESGTRDPAAAAEMALVNRHYIMTSTLGRTSALDHARLAAVEFLLVVSTLTRPRGWRQLPAVMRGKLRAIVRILRKGGG